jgi:hypothetical protein
MLVALGFWGSKDGLKVIYYFIVHFALEMGQRQQFSEKRPNAHAIYL